MNTFTDKKRKILELCTKLPSPEVMNTLPSEQQKEMIQLIGQSLEAYERVEEKEKQVENRRTLLQSAIHTLEAAMKTSAKALVDNAMLQLYWYMMSPSLYCDGSGRVMTFLLASGIW